VPRVRALVARAQQFLSRARELANRSSQASERREREQNMREVEGIRAELAEVLKALENEGVEMKGLEPALLDFPAMYRGREVYLCWKEGEEEIRFWHPTSTGFAGRQPLDADDKVAWEWRN
jgi:hypothetical protein